MSTVYTVTIDNQGHSEEWAQEQALFRAAKFFRTDRVTAELVSYDIDSGKATFRLDKRSGSLLG